MGSVLGSLWGRTPEGFDTPDPVSGLSPRDIRAIEQSWQIVRGDMRATGVAFFLALFEAHPEHKKLFPLFADTPLAALRTSKKLEAHASSVVHNLGAVVDTLRDPGCLVELFNKIATTHRAHHVPKQAFVDFKTVFLKFLKGRLGSKLSREAEEGWEKALSSAVAIISKQLDK